MAKPTLPGRYNVKCQGVQLGVFTVVDVMKSYFMINQALPNPIIEKIRVTERVADETLNPDAAPLAPAGQPLVYELI